MSSYCLECRKNTESKNSKLVKKVTKIEECAVCDVKNQNLSKSKKLGDYYVAYGSRHL